MRRRFARWRKGPHGSSFRLPPERRAEERLGGSLTNAVPRIITVCFWHKMYYV